MTVAITRGDLTSADLRREAARTQDAKAARRMLAMALVLEGHSRETAAESCGMSATVWYAGAVSICSSGFGGSWRCRCTSARSVSCHGNWRCGGCRCDRSIHRDARSHRLHRQAQPGKTGHRIGRLVLVISGTQSRNFQSLTGD